MFIPRSITKRLHKAILGERKIIIIYGPRQAGKTTLIKALREEVQKKSLYLTGDDLFVQNLFGRPELEPLRRAAGDNEILIIDEAQRIENVGLSLKLLYDNLPVMIIASGSASFDLANKVSEPLTGRTKTFFLYPLSYAEIEDKYRTTSVETSMEEMLRFGMYPEVHTHAGEAEKEEYLYEYASNYLYKDILMFENIRKPKSVVDLLTLLALQIGKEVSIAELAQNLAISQKAVQNYLDALEKMFVIINLRGFSRNLRKEISKTSKYYFADVGLRNALIRNFNRLNLRQDAGELFENWFIMEKIKSAANAGRPANFYFWRTYDQLEIDLVEERGGKLTGYECKLSPRKKVKPPEDWLSAYQGADFKVIEPASAFRILSEPVPEA